MSFMNDYYFLLRQNFFEQPGGSMLIKQHSRGSISTAPACGSDNAEHLSTLSASSHPCSVLSF